MRRSLAIAVSVLLSWPAGAILCGCAGSADNAAPAQPCADAPYAVRSDPQPALAPNLPPPSSLKLAGAVSSGVFRPGGEYTGGLPSRRVTATADGCAVFTPDWSHSGGELAYAIYTFDATGYDHQNTIYVIWDGANDMRDAWTGVADFAADRWVWTDLDDGYTAAFGPESVDGGTVMVAVVLTGSAAWKLAHIRLGSQLPPLIKGVSPACGLQNDDASFAAHMEYISGTATGWHWEFGPAATPATSSDASPLAILGPPGIYECSVTASNATGADTCEFLVTINPAGTTWRVEAVTGGGGISSLALQTGEAALPHIGFASGTNLRCTWSDGVAWHTSPVATCRATDGFTATGLAVDAAGVPHLAYASPAGVEYAVSSISGWDKQIVDENGSPFMTENFYAPSLALDTAGHPHASYQRSDWDDDWNMDFVLYSTNAGTGWSTPLELAESGGLMQIGAIAPWHPLALAADGTPWISYYNSDHPYTLYALTLDGTWDEQAVNSGDKAKHVSLAIDSSGLPRVCYSVKPSSIVDGELHYASFDGTNWHPTILLGAGDVGSHVSLKLDSNGHPQIAYYEATIGALRFAFHTGVLWTYTTVDNSADTGLYPSLALDSDDLAHISYYDSTNDCIKYAVRPAP